MPQLDVSTKVKVRYEDGGFRYIFDVEVMAISSSSEFIGRIDRIFAAGDGEVTGGKIFELKGQKAKFKNDDLVMI